MTNLSVEDFATKVSDSSVVVLDVRTAGEFQEGHIQNAINIDYEGLNFEGEVNKLDKTKTYAVYCRSGRRSGLATEVLAKNGFASIFNLNGGVIDWQAAQLLDLLGQREGKPCIFKLTVPVLNAADQPFFFYAGQCSQCVLVIQNFGLTQCFLSSQ